MKIIPLTNRGQAIVCDCHHDLVVKFKWFRNMDGYAARTVNLGNGKFKTIRMHRLIADTPKGLHTDHANGDRLDNRCSNLRAATNSQNQYNKGMLRSNTSGVKGVGWMKECRKWRADIGFEGRLIYLGLFESIEDATRARKEAETKYHGEFARC